MKLYQYFYRKRGQPESPEQNGLLEATGFYNANSKAAETVGSDYVITRVVKRKENNESTRLPNENQ